MMRLHRLPMLWLAVGLLGIALLSGLGVRQQLGLRRELAAQHLALQATLRQAEIQVWAHGDPQSPRAPGLPSRPWQALPAWTPRSPGLPLQSQIWLQQGQQLVSPVGLGAVAGDLSGPLSEQREDSQTSQAPVALAARGALAPGRVMAVTLPSGQVNLVVVLPLQGGQPAWLQVHHARRRRTVCRAGLAAGADRLWAGGCPCLARHPVVVAGHLAGTGPGCGRCLDACPPAPGAGCRAARKPGPA